MNDREIQSCRARWVVLCAFLSFVAPMALASDDGANFTPTGFHYAVLDIGDLLGSVGGNYPAGINNLGSVVAYGPRFVTDSVHFGFLWSNGQLFSSTQSSSGNYVPVAVNDFDMAVGFTGSGNGAVWTPGSTALRWQEFPLQGYPVGIRNNGQPVYGPALDPRLRIGWLGTNYQDEFVGYNGDPGGSPAGARLYDRGSLIDLPFATATGINRFGVIVGSVDDLQSNGTYLSDAIIYSNSTVYRLQELPGLNALPSLNSVAGINDYGQMVARIAGIDSHEIVRLTPFKAYSQVDGAWRCAPVNPRSAHPESIGAVGCALVSLSTVATYFGAHVNPLDVSNAVRYSNSGRSNSLALPTNQIFTFGDSSFKITSRGSGYDRIVSALRSGEPVMLFVPSLATGTAADYASGHYVVAYQFAQGVRFDSAGISPDQIEISDPGTATNTLTTLGAYFRNHPNGKYSFSPRTWFDTGTDDSGAYQNSKMDKLVTTFSRVIPGISGNADGAGPMIAVHSPVDLIITDGPNRFATSADIALHGETVLPHLQFDTALADNEDPPPIDDPTFPPYFVQLPPEMAGESLDVEIYGKAYGNYEISYLSGDQRYLSNDVLTGLAFESSMDVGHFTVVDASVPEPSLLIVTMLPLCLARRRNPKAG